MNRRRKYMLLVAGVLTWSLTMVKSGALYKFGLGFWGPNGHDGVWHVALANSLARGSLEMPTFSGEQLQNYHIGFDLILAFVHLSTSIPINTLYFQIFPPLIAIGTGLLTYSFVRKWKSESAALWSVFFIYFGGSLGWIVSFARERMFGGESMFWAQQSISTLINPPFALSLLIIFLGLNILYDYRESKRIDRWLIPAVLFGLLIQVKAYAGVLTVGSLFISGLYVYLKEKEFWLLKTALVSFITAVIVFLPLNESSSSLVVFKPFWFLETMVGLSDRFNWERLASAMTSYRTGGFWIKAIAAYSLTFLIFIIGNFWTRLMSLFYVCRRVVERKLDAYDVFLFTLIVSGVVLPTFFLQAGTPWNTIQFMYYSLIFSGVIAGLYVSKLPLAIKIVIVLLTIPTTAGTLYYHYLPSRPPAKVSKKELEALSELKQLDEGVVLTYPFDRTKAAAAQASPPRPLYLYESTAYVAAYGSQPVYLQDEVNLDITGYDWPERRAEIIEFFLSNDIEEAREFIKNIEYLYLVKPLSPLPGEVLRHGPAQLGLQRVFENSEVVIYKTTGD